MAAVTEVIRDASSEPVVQAGARRTHNGYPFLDLNSPLIESPEALTIDEKLKSPIDPNERTLFADFLSVAATHHLFEGWRFLSKTAYSLACGSQNAATHLGYYAELRAARAILAIAGVHIGNYRHFLLCQNGDVVLLDREKPRPQATGKRLRTIKDRFFKAFLALRGKQSEPKEERQFGTHIAAWAALKHWSKNREITKEFAQRMQALNYQGIDWVRACNATQSGSEIVADWLSDWCFDLKQLSKDSRLRNSASYGVRLAPDAFPEFNRTNIDVVSGAAEACSDFDGLDADQLDLILLNDFCVKTFRMIFQEDEDEHKLNDRNDGRIWNRLTAHLRNFVGLTESEAEELIERIRLAPNLPGFRVVENADASHRDAVGVFSRAFLLLRLATVMHHWYWQQVRQISPNAATWQSDLLSIQARHANLDTMPPLFQDYFDLLQDAQDAVENLSNWHGGTPFTGHKLWSEARAIA